MKGIKHEILFGMKTEGLKCLFLETTVKLSN
jgi:hypothetical protein